MIRRLIISYLVMYAALLFAGGDLGLLTRQREEKYQEVKRLCTRYDMCECQTHPVHSLIEEILILDCAIAVYTEDYTPDQGSTEVLGAQARSIRKEDIEFIERKENIIWKVIDENQKTLKFSRQINTDRHYEYLLERYHSIQDIIRTYTQLDGYQGSGWFKERFLNPRHPLNPSQSIFRK